MDFNYSLLFILKIIGKEVKNAQQNNGLTINIPMLFSKPYIVAPFLGLLLFLLAILLLILSSSVCYAARLQYENTIQLIDALTNSSIKYPAQISVQLKPIKKQQLLIIKR